MESSPLVIYIENLKPHSHILKSYEIIRKWLQESGKTSKEIEHINQAPDYVWMEHNKIIAEMEIIKSDLKRYGILNDSNEEEFNNFMVSELKEISEKYPLIDNTTN